MPRKGQQTRVNFAEGRGFNADSAEGVVSDVRRDSLNMGILNYQERCCQCARGFRVGSVRDVNGDGVGRARGRPLRQAVPRRARPEGPRTFASPISHIFLQARAQERRQACKVTRDQLASAGGVQDKRGDGVGRARGRPLTNI